mgnify:CR=1 FL=1
MDMIKEKEQMIPEMNAPQENFKFRKAFLKTLPASTRGAEE